MSPPLIWKLKSIFFRYPEKKNYPFRGGVIPPGRIRLRALINRAAWAGCPKNNIVRNRTFTSPPKEKLHLASQAVRGGPLEPMERDKLSRAEVVLRR